jgi:pimeloyl-ACP methyl ester carboxylesterase
MSTYVLIHGAWVGGWCWDKVVPLLKQAGHQVEILDLPGHGQDRTPIHEITLTTYTKRVCYVLDAQAEPVIVVGHSMGGIVITQAAEERPEKIQMLVYLSAFLVQNGESLFQFASIDTDSLVFPNLILNEEQGYSTFKEEAPFKELFGSDCSDEDVEWAKSQLVPEALAPSVTPVHITEGNYSRVPRIYIETLRDRAVSPSIQKKMYTALPCKKIISMETGHASFFSAPEKLVRHLASLEYVNS